MAAVAGDLVPGDVVPLDQGDQRFPEIAVLHRLLLRVEPAVLAPALVPPIAEAVDHVRAVAVDGDAAPALERAKALDRSGQLHPLIGGGVLAARQLPLAAVLDDEDAPAAGPGVARAGTVRVHDHGRWRRRHRPSPRPSPWEGERVMKIRRASRGSGRRTRRG